LIFKPDTIPFKEDIRGREQYQMYIFPADEVRAQARAATGIIQRVFRVCAQNNGAEPADLVTVLLNRLEPPVQRFNDIPLHLMHDNNAEGVFQQSFSLGANDHKFIDVVFMNTFEKTCRIYHAAQHIDQILPGAAYTATLSIKARGHKPRYYQYKIRVSAGELSFEPV
jgi:hypothetical protein